MYQGRIVFSQLLDFLPKKSFRTCVSLYNGNYQIRSLTAYSGDFDRWFQSIAATLLERNDAGVLLVGSEPVLS